MNREKLRNIGIIAHVDAGKTTVTERILYYAGKTHEIGDVHHGNTAMDTDALEREKGITINSAATTVYWNQHRITIIDTPGHIDFNIEVNRSLRVLDGAVVLFDAVAGVEPQTETNWHLADRYSIPRICFVNKLDRTGADFLAVVDSIEHRLGVKTMVTQLPVVKEGQFEGIIDLISMQQLSWCVDRSGVQYRVAAIAESMLEQARQYRLKLLETVVDQDEHAMERYLQGQELEPALIKRCIRKATLATEAVAVLCGSAYKNIGVQPLLDAVVDFLPSALEGPAVECLDRAENTVTRHNDINEPFAALAFKSVHDRFGSLTYLRVYSGELSSGSSVVNATTAKKERVSRIYAMHANKRCHRSTMRAGDIVAVTGLKNTNTGDSICDPDSVVIFERLHYAEPVIDVAIEPKAKTDHNKLVNALNALIKEDPSLRMRVDSETGQTLVSGMGELHLEIKLRNLESDYGVVARTGKPQVAYRETLGRSTEVSYLHKKQSSGPGQYAKVCLQFEPLARGQGFEFVSQISGGVIPREYIPAVEKGLRNAALAGMLMGSPVVDFRATLLDGHTHEEDSSSIAFEIAAREAFKQAMQQAKPVLLEPVMKVEVITPSDRIGECIGDLNRRRGVITQQQIQVRRAVITALVPLVQMFGYIGDLSGLSSGRGQFTMQFEHYNTVPKNIAVILMGQ